MSLPLATNPLIQVTPGLMIWTIVCFLIALFVLKRYAFGPIQHTIDQRRERIRQSLDEADTEREADRLSGLGHVTGGGGENSSKHVNLLSAPARSPSRCRWRTGRRR